MEITAHTDVNWPAHRDDRRSTGGYSIFPVGNPVSWSSKKQKVISKSTCEAEYKALSHGAAEICWMKSLLSELKLSSVRSL